MALCLMPRLLFLRNIKSLCFSCEFSICTTVCQSFFPFFFLSTHFPLSQRRKVGKWKEVSRLNLFPTACHIRVTIKKSKFTFKKIDLANKNIMSFGASGNFLHKRLIKLKSFQFEKRERERERERESSRGL